MNMITPGLAIRPSNRDISADGLTKTALHIATEDR